jgi:hypothetical protein
MSSGFDYTHADLNAIQTHLDSLTANPTTAQADILRAVEMLQKRVNNNPATTLQTNIDELVAVQAEIAQAKQDLQVAKDRADSLRLTVPSYYESWFPISRPLRKTTIIVLIAIGIFFFALTFFMALHAFGFILQLNILWYNEENIAKVKKLFPYGSLLLIIGLVILTIIGWLRKA